MKTYTLPISPDYVPHWGLWEAMREIIQNAFDERDGNPECRFQFWYDGESSAQVFTSTGSLSPSSLVLGTSSKRDDTAKRGKFGEGYKLALLVLLRLGKKVHIENGPVWWEPVIVHDEAFGCDVLRIVENRAPEHAADGVRFVVGGITPEEWSTVSSRLHPCRAENKILDEPEEAGSIYVGGLFVRKLDGFLRGYCFNPSSITLDRDRGMVDGTDVALHTSRLWSARGGDEVYALLKKKAPDVEYVPHVNGAKAPIAAAVRAAFIGEHGADAVPVSTQAEITRATAAGVRWALVPDSVKALIGKIVRTFIPTTESPASRIRKLIATTYFGEGVKTELEDIAASLERQQGEAAKLVDETEAVQCPF